MGPNRGADDPLTGIDPDRINRFLSGGLTPAEEAALRRDVVAAGGAVSVLDDLRHGLSAMGRQARVDVDAEGEWHTLMKRLPDFPGRDVTRPISVATRAPSFSRFVAPMAAVIGAAAVVTVTVWSGIHRTATQPFREFASAPGSRVTITLRDGTRVVLAPATQMRVPSDFGVHARTVELTGEAWFTVVHDPVHPLTIRTARAVVRDVGTTFVVRAYPNDATDRVGVQEGEVSIGTTALMAGDLATVSDSAFIVRHHADLHVLSAWMQGGLAFDETPLQEVARDIGRAFGVTITVADSALRNKRITATFSDQALDMMLEEVTRAVGARYERTPQGIVIRSAPAHTRDHGTPTRPPLTTAQAGGIHE